MGNPSPLQIRPYPLGVKALVQQHRGPYRDTTVEDGEPADMEQRQTIQPAISRLQRKAAEKRPYTGRQVRTREHHALGGAAAPAGGEDQLHVATGQGSNPASGCLCSRSSRWVPGGKPISASTNATRTPACDSSGSRSDAGRSGFNGKGVTPAAGAARLNRAQVQRRRVITARVVPPAATEPPRQAMQFRRQGAIAKAPLAGSQGGLVPTALCRPIYPFERVIRPVHLPTTELHAVAAP